MTIMTIDVKQYLDEWIHELKKHLHKHIVKALTHMKN